MSRLARASPFTLSSIRQFNHAAITGSIRAGFVTASCTKNNSHGPTSRFENRPAVIGNKPGLPRNMSTSTATPLPLFSKKLESKRVLVIGGSSGIGFAVAAAAYEAGAKVIISSSSADKISRAVERIRQGYPSISESESRLDGYACNLADPSNLESNLQKLLDQSVTALGGGPLDHIAFTAGDALNIKPLTETSIEHIVGCGTVRFVAPILLSKLILQRNDAGDAAGQYLTPSSDSSLTLTSGSANVKPPPGGWAIATGYGAGIEGSARALAKDLKPIRVNVVSPGAVETELFSNIPDERRAAVLEGMAKDSTVGRVGRPEDLAESYLYCMRDGFFTGKVLISDGGRLLM